MDEQNLDKNIQKIVLNPIIYCILLVIVTETNDSFLLADKKKIYTSKEHIDNDGNKFVIRTKKKMKE